MNHSTCCEMTDHTPQWAGDGYFCGKCMLQFRPDHSKAPEKQNEAMFKFLEGYAEIAQKEAPTDESWEKQISSELHEQLKDKLEPWAVDLKKVFEIVASQIQKEREKAYANGYADGAQIHQNSFEAGQSAGHKEGYLEASHDLQGERAMGKSEAFSLVRKALEEMKLTMNVNEYLPKVEAWNRTYDSAFDDGYAQAKTDLLSTLEGK